MGQKLRCLPVGLVGSVDLDGSGGDMDSGVATEPSRPETLQALQAKCC